jgi:hypothetical protein
VLVTEVKGSEVSIRNCYIQLLAAGGNGVLDMFRLGWSLEDAVVPVIAFTGIGIQFGAIYLLESHFPVLTMLSDSLDTCGSRSNEDILATWLCKFVFFSLETKKLCPKHNQKQQALIESPKLKKEYFFKPVRTNCKDLSQLISENNFSFRCNNLNHIMRMYKLVHDVVVEEKNDPIERILYPVGVVTVPADNTFGAEPIRKFLLDQCARFNLEANTSANCPLIVFPLLSGWYNDKPKQQYRVDYMEQVRLCLDQLNAAKG